MSVGLVAQFPPLPAPSDPRDLEPDPDPSREVER